MLPSRELRSIFPSFVDEFFGTDLLNNFFETRTGINTPAVNIVEGKDDFRIEVAAPGLDKKDFKIDIDNNMLSISAEKENKVKEEEDNYVRREFGYTSFKRTFTLPDSVNADQIKATHKEGILQITIPKKEEARVKPPKKIEIS
ncbi:MAG TPA: Hsp20/alpha crystallin family protein [Bacteroidales bacterium]|nr:Hsp20/alpha crystallin family protein [Bacteroidales bacterium]